MVGLSLEGTKPVMNIIFRKLVHTGSVRTENAKIHRGHVGIVNLFFSPDEISPPRGFFATAVILVC